MVGLLAGVSAAAAATVAAVSSQVEAAASSSADPTAPMALSGPVPGGATSVAVAVLPRDETLGPGESAEHHVLGDAEVTMSENGFEAFIDPLDVPSSYVGTDGLVDVVVDAGNGDDIWETQTTVRLVRTEGDALSEAFWSDPAESADDVVGDNQRLCGSNTDPAYASK